MKRVNGFITGICLIMFLSVTAMSQDQSNRGRDMRGQGSMMRGGGMMGQDGMMGMDGMCGMMMMGGMMGRAVVPVDGGVVVMVGNKLQKYDKDLKLVKEVELKIDMQGMQKMMQGMMEQCPMRNQPAGQGRGTVPKSTGTATDEHGH